GRGWGDRRCDAVASDSAGRDSDDGRSITLPQEIDRLQYVVNHSNASVPALLQYERTGRLSGQTVRGGVALRSRTEFGHNRSFEVEIRIFGNF
ncbi:hypothetical protein, partial [Burkholderia multivorans]